MSRLPSGTCIKIMHNLTISFGCVLFCSHLSYQVSFIIYSYTTLDLQVFTVLSRGIFSLPRIWDERRSQPKRSKLVCFSICSLYF